MKLPPHLESLIQYTAFAATTIQQIANSTNVPFLGTAATLTSSILTSVQSSRSFRGDYMQLVEHIHEILCSIVSLYASSETDGSLPHALLYDIATLTKILQKIYSFLNTQQRMGKLKQLFTQSENISQLEGCKNQLQASLDVFRVSHRCSIELDLTRPQSKVGVSNVAGMARMQMDAERRHEELLSLLATHTDLTNSDNSSSITGSLSIFGNSSGSLSMLPPFPQIFHGRDSELQMIVNSLMQEPARIAILGSGGMGKTSLASAALHHDDVVVKYPYRYFVPCHSTATCADLIATIAAHIGLEKGATHKSIFRHFAYAPASLLVLDNFETPWEPMEHRAKVEEFLSYLADVSHLAILITIRGAERPGKVKWTRPFLRALDPLSDDAALQTFVDLAEDFHDENDVRQLLELTGNLPLAINLIASVVAYEGCDTTLARWRTESIRLLSDGYDKRTSLEISITLSLTSSRMTPGALEFLSILSLLPDGVSDAELSQYNLPISDIFTCKATLLRTSLAFMGNDKRLTLLVPIREYISRVHPPSAALKFALRQHFHKILDLWGSFKNDLHSTDMIPQIISNLGNSNSVFSDALSADGPDTVQVLRSALILHDFNDNANKSTSPLLLTVAEKIVDWKDDPIYGNFLIAIIRTSSLFPIGDVENHIAFGIQYFQSADALEQGEL
ncbi:P-loop containing nucleoside triphosphate hydrolase protein [Mycena sp. CBHHK59/15]|nr:P-loop containing nucleoside triphosphate hydrolase protein [Mycena sp. CBHHK59/15]